MSAGFFPNGQCRHYQLVDGWAKIWCVRTDAGHTEHETSHGLRWIAEPQGAPSDAFDLDALEALAKAATPGPWEYIFGGPTQDEDGSWYEPTESGVRSSEWEQDFPHADAEFIAAVDPQTVLALIAALRAGGGR